MGNAQTGLKWDHQSLLHGHWSETPLVRDSTGQRLHWSETPLVRDSTGQRLHWSETPLVRDSTGQRLHWSETPLVRDSTGQRLHWSETPLVRDSTGQRLYGQPARTDPVAQREVIHLQRSFPVEGCDIHFDCQ